MNTSSEGVAKIKVREGLKLEAYQCSANEWTIGYGTRYTAVGPVRKGQRITESAAEELLLSDLRLFERRINDLVKIPLRQNEFDALVSLVYNIGTGAFASSTLLRLLNKQRLDEAADEFLRWNKVRRGGVFITEPGLTSRRIQERQQFLDPNDPEPEEV